MDNVTNNHTSVTTTEASDNNSTTKQPIEEVNIATSTSINASQDMLSSQQQQHQGQFNNDEVVDPDDPLLIAQTLTYVTDDGSVVLSFTSAPFSFAFKLRFVVIEIIFVVLLIVCVPVGAHGTVVSLSLGNMAAVAWFWYNSVRSIDITNDGGLRFWIGNVEIDIPFDKIVSMRRLEVNCPCSIISPHLLPHMGYLSNPLDGVAVITSVPCTPCWSWPRSVDKPERKCCFGHIGCPKMVIIFSPAGGASNFINEVENEMRSCHLDNNNNINSNHRSNQFHQPPAYPVKIPVSSISTTNNRSNSNSPPQMQEDFFDV